MITLTTYALPNIFGFQSLLTTFVLAGKVWDNPDYTPPKAVPELIAAAGIFSFLTFDALAVSHLLFSSANTDLLYV